VRVRVLYFAVARDLASVSGESVLLPDGATVRGLLEEVMRLHPNLKKIQRSIRFSVNFEVVDRGDALHNGDEVGVLPPVAGG